jgi:hypothetical protein
VNNIPNTVPNNGAALPGAYPNNNNQNPNNPNNPNNQNNNGTPNGSATPRHRHWWHWF